MAMLMQPPSVVTEYEISDVPAFKPVNIPLFSPMAAIPGESLAHVPPDVVLVHSTVVPMHTGFVPVMVCTTGEVTVTVVDAVLIQPPSVTTEYVIVDVPGFKPVRFPVSDPMAAMPGDSLVHTPPVVVLVHTTVDPTQTGVTPSIN